MANLLLLCERHHHLLHEHAFRIEALGRQRFRFIRGDGEPIADHVHPDRYNDQPKPVEAEHPVDPVAATPRWNGDKLDRDWAISVLAQRRAMFASERRAA